jgi:hypothetical protein
MIPTYVIGDQGKNITCPDCGLTNWTPEDVRRPYCSHCREFHDDKEKKARPWELTFESPALGDPFFDWF